MDHFEITPISGTEDTYLVRRVEPKCIDYVQNTNNKPLAQQISKPRCGRCEKCVLDSIFKSNKICRNASTNALTQCQNNQNKIAYSKSFTPKYSSPAIFPQKKLSAACEPFFKPYNATIALKAAQSIWQKNFSCNEACPRLQKQRRKKSSCCRLKQQSDCRVGCLKISTTDFTQIINDILTQKFVEEAPCAQNFLKVDDKWERLKNYIRHIDLCEEANCDMNIVDDHICKICRGSSADLCNSCMPNETQTEIECNMNRRKVSISEQQEICGSNISNSRTSMIRYPSERNSKHYLGDPVRSSSRLDSSKSDYKVQNLNQYSPRGSVSRRSSINLNTCQRKVFDDKSTNTTSSIPNDLNLINNTDDYDRNQGSCHLRSRPSIKNSSRRNSTDIDGDPVKMINSLVSSLSNTGIDNQKKNISTCNSPRKRLSISEQQEKCESNISNSCNIDKTLTNTISFMGNDLNQIKNTDDKNKKQRKCSSKSKLRSKNSSQRNLKDNDKKTNISRCNMSASKCNSIANRPNSQRNSKEYDLDPRKTSNYPDRISQQYNIGSYSVKLYNDNDLQPSVDESKVLNININLGHGGLTKENQTEDSYYRSDKSIGYSGHKTAPNKQESMEDKSVEQDQNSTARNYASFKAQKPSSLKTFSKNASQERLNTVEQSKSATFDLYPYDVKITVSQAQLAEDGPEDGQGNFSVVESTNVPKNMSSLAVKDGKNEFGSNEQQTNSEDEDLATTAVSVIKIVEPPIQNREKSIGKKPKKSISSLNSSKYPSEFELSTYKGPNPLLLSLRRAASNITTEPTEQTNQTKQINQTQRINQTDETNQTKRTNQPDETNQTKRINQTDETNQTKQINQTNETNETKQTDQDDQSKHTDPTYNSANVSLKSSFDNQVISPREARLSKLIKIDSRELMHRQNAKATDKDEDDIFDINRDESHVSIGRSGRISLRVPELDKEKSKTQLRPEDDNDYAEEHLIKKTDIPSTITTSDTAKDNENTLDTISSSSRPSCLVKKKEKCNDTNTSMPQSLCASKIVNPCCSYNQNLTAKKCIANDNENALDTIASSSRPSCLVKKKGKCNDTKASMPQSVCVTKCDNPCCSYNQNPTDRKCIFFGPEMCPEQNLNCLGGNTHNFRVCFNEIIQTFSPDDKYCKCPEENESNPLYCVCNHLANDICSECELRSKSGKSDLIESLTDISSPNILGSSINEIKYLKSNDRTVPIKNVCDCMAQTSFVSPQEALLQKQLLNHKPSNSLLNKISKIESSHFNLNTGTKSLYNKTVQTASSNLSSHNQIRQCCDSYINLHSVSTDRETETCHNIATNTFCDRMVQTSFNTFDPLNEVALTYNLNRVGLQNQNCFYDQRDRKASTVDRLAYYSNKMIQALPLSLEPSTSKACKTNTKNGQYISTTLIQLDRYQKSPNRENYYKFITRPQNIQNEAFFINNNSITNKLSVEEYQVNAPSSVGRIDCFTENEKTNMAIAQTGNVIIKASFNKFSNSNSTHEMNELINNRSSSGKENNFESDCETNQSQSSFMQNVNEYNELNGSQYLLDSSKSTQTIYKISKNFSNYSLENMYSSDDDDNATSTPDCFMVSRVNVKNGYGKNKKSNDHRLPHELLRPLYVKRKPFNSNFSNHSQNSIESKFSKLSNEGNKLKYKHSNCCKKEVRFSSDSCIRKISSDSLLSDSSNNEAQSRKYQLIGKNIEIIDKSKRQRYAEIIQSFSISNESRKKMQNKNPARQYVTTFNKTQKWRDNLVPQNMGLPWHTNQNRWSDHELKATQNIYSNSPTTISQPYLQHKRPSRERTKTDYYLPSKHSMHNDSSLDSIDQRIEPTRAYKVQQTQAKNQPIVNPRSEQNIVDTNLKPHMKYIGIKTSDPDKEFSRTETEHPSRIKAPYKPVDVERWISSSENNFRRVYKPVKVLYMHSNWNRIAKNDNSDHEQDTTFRC